MRLTHHRATKFSIVLQCVQLTITFCAACSIRQLPQNLLWLSDLRNAEIKSDHSLRAKFRTASHVALITEVESADADSSSPGTPPVIHASFQGVSKDQIMNGLRTELDTGLQGFTVLLFRCLSLGNSRSELCKAVSKHSR